jgi:putative aminopeptidase FrvX
MKNEEQFIYKYLNAFSPVGEESEGQQIWIDEVNNYVDGMYVDPYGTAVGRVETDSFHMNKPPRVVIEAHCDEIAWIITNIEKEGYIRVKRHGGSDNMIAPSKDIVVHTKNGKINGVFGWPAIHTRDSYVEEGPDQHELWVDLGAESDEEVAELGVEVGNIVTFNDPLRQIGNYWVGRSLDNKIGGYIIAEVAKRLKERDIKLPFDLYVVNSVQEEVGLYGAKMIAKRLQADLALVHDVCHNTNTPRIEKSKDGNIKGGKGPTLEYTAQNHRKINNMIEEIAKKNDIPVQKAVGSYGNDTMAFFLENTPTAILATPLKYMHTTVEMAHVDDVENCIELYINVLQSIDSEVISEIHNKKLNSFTL